MMQIGQIDRRSSMRFDPVLLTAGRTWECEIDLLLLST